MGETHLLGLHGRLLHPVHSSTPTNALLATWAWHLLTGTSSSHGPALVWHESKRPAMHGSSLPRPEISHRREKSTLALRNTRHEVWRIHLHLVLQHTTSCERVVSTHTHTHRPVACDWTSSACEVMPGEPASLLCAEPMPHTMV